MWGANEDGNYDWALYSVKIDTSTEGVTYSYITEGYGLFAGLRDLSNKDNTNSYPCLYYSTSTGTSGLITIDVYEKIPSGSTPSKLSTITYYTQSHNGGYWLLSRDVSYSSATSYFYYLQNFRRSSGTKDRFLNTIVYNTVPYNTIRLLSYSDQDYFYPQYNEVQMFNTIGDLIIKYCTANALYAFYDYDEDKLKIKDITDYGSEYTMNSDYYTYDVVPFHSKTFKKIKINSNSYTVFSGTINDLSSELNISSIFNLLSGIYSAIKLRKANCYKKNITKYYVSFYAKI